MQVHSPSCRNFDVIETAGRHVDPLHGGPTAGEGRTNSAQREGGFHGRGSVPQLTRLWNEHGLQPRRRRDLMVSRELLGFCIGSLCHVCVFPSLTVRP